MPGTRGETAKEHYEWWEFEDQLSPDDLITYRFEKEIVEGGAEFTIQRGGKTITTKEVPRECLEPKVLQLLEYFLIHGIVGFPRRNVEDALWRRGKNPAASFGLCLGDLRVLLNDKIPPSDKNKPKSGRLIITERGKGLRFGGLNLRHEGPVPSSARLHGVPLLLHFIPRPDLLAAVKRHLLDTAERTAIALQGMGGSGKTFLAIKVCRDPEIRHAFPDGIIWLHIGRQSTTPFIEHIETIRKRMGAPQSDEEPVDSYRELLQEKAALIVLDDVWNPAQLQLFLFPAGRSCLLYTTRNEALADEAHAKSVPVGRLESADARKFLETWSGSVMPEPHATGILRECEGLALALAVIGATLQKKPAEHWVDILNLLRSAKLRNIQGSPDGYYYATLHAAIEVSVNALEDLGDTYRSRYLRLGLLADGARVPTSLLQLLWNVTRSEALKLGRLFASRSLARLDAVDGLSLHELQLKYLHGEYPDSALIALVHAAFRRSSHAIRQHPDETYVQLVGRLLPHCDIPAVAEFLKSLEPQAPKPRFRPLSSAMDSAGDPSSRVFQGPGAVCSIAISSGAQRAISAHGDGTVICWDLTFEETPRVQRNAAIAGAVQLVPVSSTIALTADGRRAVWGQENSLAVWDLDSDDEPRILPRQDHQIWAVALSEDGTLAACSTGPSITVWDLATNEKLCILAGIDIVPCTLVFCWDKRHIFGGYVDGTIMYWEMCGSTGEAQRFETQRHAPTGSDWIYTVAIEPSRLYVATSPHPTLPGFQDPEFQSNKRQITVWDLNEYPARSHPSPVYEESPVGILSMACAGPRILAGGDASLFVDDVERGVRNTLDRPPSSWITAVALTPDYQFGISGDAAGQMVIWDLSHGMRTIPSHDAPVITLAFTPDGQQLVSGSEDKTLIFWSLKGDVIDRRDTPTPPWTPGHDPAREQLDRASEEMFAPSGDQLEEDSELPDEPVNIDLPVVVYTAPIVRDIDEVHAYNEKRSRRADTAEGRAAPIYALAVSDLSRPGVVRFLEGPASPIHAVALAPDCSAVASSHGYWQDLRRPDPRGRMVYVGNTHDDAPLAVALSVRGERVMAGYQDGALRLWDIDGKMHLLRGHDGRVWALALSPDGAWALSGGDAAELLAWDLRDSPSSRVLLRPRNPVTAVALTSDGHRAAAAFADGEILLWDLGASAVPRRLRLHKDPVFCLSFSPDGKRLLSGGADHILAAWDLHGDRPPATLTTDAEIRCCAATLTHAAAGDNRGRVHLFALDD